MIFYTFDVYIKINPFNLEGPFENEFTIKK